MANLLGNSETIEQQIRLFDDVRPIGARIFLLKSGSNTAKFDLIIEMTGGWFVKFNKFREQMEFVFATIDELFNNKFAQMSHIGYGTLDADNEIDVYAIERQDGIPPNAAQPNWKAFGKRLDNERYRVITIADGDGIVIFP